MRKIFKLNIFHLVEKIVRFLVDCGPQIRQGSQGLGFYVASYVFPQIGHDIYSTGLLEVARVGHK